MNQLSKTKSIVTGVASLVLGVASAFLFFKHGFGLNYTVFVFMVVSFGLFLAQLFGIKIRREHYTVIFMGLFFSVMVYIRSGELLTFYNFLGSSLLLLLAVVLFTGKQLHALVFTDYLKTPFIPFRFIVPFLETLRSLCSFENLFVVSGRKREVIRGTIMALIALFVFTWLLSSADVMFNKLFSSIFTFHFPDDFPGRIIFGSIVTAFFMGAFGFIFRTAHPTVSPNTTTQTPTLGILETTILFGSINVLFAVFVILQISYLFGGADHLVSSGLTYAQYAREGFAQLIWVAIGSFLLITFAEHNIVRHEGAHVRRFRLLSGTLVILVLAILVSAFTRLSLYEDAYGFTDTRFYSHALMIWLSGMLVILSLHIWKSGTRAQFMFRAFVLSVAFLALLNLVNPDVFIAKQNLARYAQTGNIDARYLGILSIDALPYTIMLLNDPRTDIQNDFIEGLRISRRSDHSWQSSRWGDVVVRQTIPEYKALVNTLGE